MDLIVQTTFDLWNAGRRVKKSPSGWESGNAVCCHHRGEHQDKRGRAGLLITSDGCIYRCFNCNFKTGYKMGGVLGVKFKKLLSWLGADDNVITALIFESLRTLEHTFQDVTQSKIFTEVELPDGCEPLVDVADEFPDHVRYLESRGLTPSSYPFMVTKIDEKSRFSKRIILPFIRYGRFVGYTARSISLTVKPRYIMRMASPYVFGIDLQQYDWKWAILTEGPFDALSVDGLGIMHNVVSDDQANIINNLGKRIITVPDFDKAGLENKENLVQDALDNNWWVSFPDWGSPKIKDINNAVLEYGVLATVQMIIKNATNNPAKIILQRKFYLNKNK